MNPSSRVAPQPGQESVWDYPRPPRIEQSEKHLEIMFGGMLIVDTRHAWRILETSHPPVYYIPQDDIRMDFLTPAKLQTFCEWKGMASYWNLTVSVKTSGHAAWSYPNPVDAYLALKDHLAFYPGKMDECRVNGEVVMAQSGDFYGGWITHDIVGPFKG
ncbi:hypothetical protein CCAX7_63440 [Capsulimonas corticalis]|uniref:DUF427 domain-containing protein n=1 Tax=Capsulimonas corticalis TaxID=2219043 RepID=A0A402CWX6_9BACT|nr:DUF427 domain-containing protein [Capsulimonas corticalis]BDI34293.1 hypothetical protein CCAX7_63440 [Capsulimonas corticalis]